MGRRAAPRRVQDIELTTVPGATGPACANPVEVEAVHMTRRGHEAHHATVGLGPAAADGEMRDLAKRSWPAHA